MFYLIHQHHPKILYLVVIDTNKFNMSYYFSFHIILLLLAWQMEFVASFAYRFLLTVYIRVEE